MKTFPLLFVMVIWTLTIFCKKSDGQIKYARVDSLTDALKYLVQFGYLKDLKEVATLLTPTFTGFDPLHPAVSAMRIAFTKFQQYSKLPVTGQFDDATKTKMNTPRCGNKDFIQIGTPIGFNNLLRRRRYVAGSFKWQKRELTYKVSKFSNTDLPKEIILKEVDLAFELWGNATNLYFIRSDSSTTVDIEMKFARLAHGDIEPFDGRGITLAHAYPPGPDIGGDIHFDDDEEWTSGIYRGTNFLHVVVHELGHALGLRHSDDEDAIMYAFARPYEPNLKLHRDDIEGIQEMYGPNGDALSNDKTTTTEKSFTTQEPLPEVITTKSPKNEDDDIKPDLCQNSKLDAITSIADGSVYAFKGKYAFRIDPNGKGIMKEYTDKISYVFYGMPGPVDAALTYEGKTYLFKGSLYWRYVNRKLDGSFPRKISEDFPFIPDNLDAAFTWPEDNQMYFFKGDKYWSFNPVENPPVARGYRNGRPISQWFGLPTKDLDAVFTSPNGPTYFFKSDDYWLFDDENFQVAETEPPYPRSSRVMWFACTPFRPDAGELKKGFITKALNTIKNVVKDVKGHIDHKVKKLTGWLF